ncbi:MAG: hypothetical protein N4A50_12205 [Vallitalea sp.]|jgi:CHASE3 domain sensor protein|nr:hypothetical protein [Vallitalea sp.]
MVIKENDIELILQSINTSYAEAEKALIKSNGDVNKAIAYLQKKKHSKFRKIYNKLKTAFGDIFRYKLIITRNKEILINLPIVLIIIFLLIFSNAGFGYPEFLLVMLLIILTDCKATIEKNNSSHESSEKNTVFSNNKTDNMDDIISTLDVIEEDEYNEIVVEN